MESDFTLKQLPLTDLVVYEDSVNREYVLMLGDAEVARVTYADVHAALKKLPQQRVSEVVMGFMFAPFEDLASAPV